MTSIRYRSRQSGDNAVKVLRAMEARQLRLWHRVCSALLEDRYAALQLTSYLRRRTTALGVVPTAPQLEQYLRVYAADGAIHDAERYAAAIRRFGAPLERGRGEQQRPRQHVSPVLGPCLNSHPRPLGKRSVNAHDWTAALSVAAYDTAVDAKSLVRLFMRTRPPTAEFRSGLVSHTTNPRAAAAPGVGARLHLLDEARALGDAVRRARTRGGAAGDDADAAEAFALLEAYAARPSSFSSPSPSSSQSPYRTDLKTAVPLRVLTGTIHALMRAILRPDLIFRLWDAMGPLYAVRPSLETLRIILDATQLPHLLDDSIPGQLALLTLENPFRARLRLESESKFSPKPEPGGAGRGDQRTGPGAVPLGPRLPAHPETGGPPPFIVLDDLFLLPPALSTKRKSSPPATSRGRRASAAPFPELSVLRERDRAVDPFTRPERRHAAACALVERYQCRTRMSRWWT
ncbi:hypothetical protein K438DRAFT_2017914 [Mycena galopus ATCC 62051]|nr:hypothetical protein K438DRAFT_2017914 [Mycena galopus ATCC 62051]